MVEVEADGEFVKAIAEGRVPNTTSRQAFEHRKKLKRCGICSTGMNCLQTEEEERPVGLRPARPEAVAEQIDHLERNRAERDDARVMQALRRISGDTRKDDNVMPGMIDAVEICVTVGEVSQYLAEVYGRCEEPVAL